MKVPGERPAPLLLPPQHVRAIKAVSAGRLSHTVADDEANEQACGTPCGIAPCTPLRFGTNEEFLTRFIRGDLLGSGTFGVVRA